MKIISFVSRWLSYLSVTVLVLMMLLTVADVTGRYFFSEPLPGTTEITKLMMIIIVFPALAWCALNHSHIRVELFVSRLSPRAQAIFNIVTLILSLGIYFIITWQSFLESLVVNRQTSLLELSFTPFYWIMSIGLAVFCISIIVLIIENIVRVVKNEC